MEVLNFDNNNNIIEGIIYTDNYADLTPGQIYKVVTMTYDYTKNSPFMNTTSFFPFYSSGEVNKTYGNSQISIHHSVTDCTYYDEHTYNDNGFPISSVRTSSCDSDFLILYN